MCEIDFSRLITVAEIYLPVYITLALRNELWI